jgi:hypothetical protein
MPVIRRSLSAVSKPETSDCNKRGYNVREAAMYIGVSVWQVRQWAQSGELTPGRIGSGKNAKQLFDKAVLDKFMDKLFAEAA